MSLYCFLFAYCTAACSIVLLTADRPLALNTFTIYLEPTIVWSSNDPNRTDEPLVNKQTNLYGYVQLMEVLVAYHW